MRLELKEAISFYRSQGAPADQNALIGLLKELQQESGGTISMESLNTVADMLTVRQSYLLALIRRLPSLRLADSHLLEVCAGPNCRKCTTVAACAEAMESSRITVKFVPCMRMCGKGPNIKWDGRLYHQADAALLKKLAEDQ